MTTKFELRSVTEAEFSVAVDWAKSEGWNPGLKDIEAFFRADPDGFVMGFLDGRPISSISVIRYGDDYGFLGFYIVHEDFRSRGFGLRTWNYGLNHLEGRTIGLDGVVAQQENYSRSGFRLYGRNIRYSGQAKPDVGRTLPSGIFPMRSQYLQALIDYDVAIFRDPRKAFLTAWASWDPADVRWTFVSMDTNRVKGYATIRQCFDGFKIGPLFADDGAVAQRLFQACLTRVAPGTNIVLDVPEERVLAVKLAESAGMVPVFETARMYLGDVPKHPFERVYGITTFELG